MIEAYMDDTSIKGWTLAYLLLFLETIFRAEMFAVLTLTTLISAVQCVDYIKLSLSPQRDIPSSVPSRPCP